MAPCGWCQCFSLACHCPSQYPSSPGFFCCFARCLGCAALLSLWLCAHLQLGRGFLLLPACPSPSFGLLVYWFLWLLFSTRVPYLRDGVGPVGALGELRWLHLYHLTPNLVGLLLFAGCLWCSGRCFLFTVRHSARIHGDHLVNFTDSCMSLARHPRMGLFLGHLRGV